METIKVQMDEKRAKEFRAVAMQIYGHKKGAISEALNKAVDEWLLRSKMGQQRRKTPNWRKLIGTLKEEKMSSVKYQHCITKEIWPAMGD